MREAIRSSSSSVRSSRAQHGLETSKSRSERDLRPAMAVELHAQVVEFCTSVRATVRRHAPIVENLGRGLLGLARVPPRFCTRNRTGAPPSIAVRNDRNTRANSPAVQPLTCRDVLRVPIGAEQQGERERHRAALGGKVGVCGSAREANALRGIGLERSCAISESRADDQRPLMERVSRRSTSPVSSLFLASRAILSMA